MTKSKYTDSQLRSMTAYFGLKLRVGSGTPLHCVAWAITVVACVIAFAGGR